jgi:hypothetical protein
MPVRTGGTAPYAPGETVMQAIMAFRERGLTTPITEDVLIRASIPESLAKRTRRSMEGLDLLDENGNPTAEFEGLRRAPTAEFKQRLEALIRSVYAEVFQFTDPAKDDADKVADAFRAYDPPGQRSRMVALFLKLCAAAGIVPEGGVKLASNGARPTTSARRGTAFSTRLNRDRGSVGATAQVRTTSGGVIPPAILGALAGLPTAERGWTTTEREHFIKGITALIDFSIPVRPEAPPSDGDLAGEDE